MKPMNGRLVKPNPMKPGMGQGPTNPGMPGPKRTPKSPGGAMAPKAPGRAGMGQRMMGQPMSKKAALQKRLGR